MPTSPTDPSPWQQLSSARRASVAAVAVVEIALTGIALRDLVRRPASQVRGSKPVWFAVCLVQPVGPPLYLLAGRAG